MIPLTHVLQSSLTASIDVHITGWQRRDPVKALVFANVMFCAQKLNSLAIEYGNRPRQNGRMKLMGWERFLEVSGRHGRIAA
jgi:hypothetical protein